MTKLSTSKFIFLRIPRGMRFVKKTDLPAGILIIPSFHIPMNLGKIFTEAIYSINH